jgi:DNA-binding transcriptional ArsR family regulator
MWKILSCNLFVVNILALGAAPKARHSIGIADSRLGNRLIFCLRYITSNAYMSAVAPQTDTFLAVADPTRRAILNLLREGERPAGDLVRAFPDASQPGISRHLRVLRESGLVDVKRDQQRRIYSLQRHGFAELDGWIARYRAFWPEQLDALTRHLDAQPNTCAPDLPSASATSTKKNLKS